MDKDRIDQIIDRHHGEASSLIQILLDIQGENNWLPREALERISQRLQVPLARIQHIATFYKAFSLVPKGRHKVHICMGTACHVRGAARLLEQLERDTGVAAGGTAPDLSLNVEEVSCVGACAIGPLVIVDGDTHGHMTPDNLSRMVTRLLDNEGPA
jgi:NADH-quinone oxidoreductase subunit E